MNKVAQVKDFIRAGIFVAASVTFLVAFVAPSAMAFVHSVQVSNQVNSIPEAVIRADRESAFRVVCPQYAAASTWERWTNGFYREISWCKDYENRL